MYKANFELLSTSNAPKTEIPEGIRMLGSPLEWPETKGEGIKVAVLDTGRPEHPDIKVKASYASPDLIHSTHEYDRNGHATHVCGTVAANGKIKGVAPEAELYTAKVLDDLGQGSDKTIADGVYWAIGQKVDVINLSLGGRQPQTMLHNAIKYAVEQGIIVVCASGNDGKNWMAYPARFPETIAVAAIDKYEKWVDFSSVGPEVELVALGVDVESTYLNSRYATLRGTSMACPHIAGAAALIQAKSRLRFGRKLTLEEMRQSLHLFAKDIGVPGRDDKYGFGVFAFGRLEVIDYVLPEIDLEIGNSDYYVNGEKKGMDTVPVLDKNNRTLVPIRFIAEEYGAKVDFIPPKRVRLR